MGQDNLNQITTAISNAQGDLVTVAVAVLGVAAVIFGIRKVYNMVTKG